MSSIHHASDDAGRWPTIPVVSVAVWHAVGVLLSIAVATVGQLAAISTHEMNRDSLVFYACAVAVLTVLWVAVRRTESRWSLLLWPLTVAAGLSAASSVAPAAASLCTSTIVLGFLYAGLTQPRASSLILMPFALPAYLFVNRAIPADQLAVRACVIVVVWVAATEMPAWLTVRLRHARAELARLAATDPLTGLANRRHWDEQVSELMSRSEAPAVLLVDLDHFKRFNDEHGHLAGDEMLIAFAQVIEQSIAAGDLAARWGGEEFAVAVRDLARAHEVAEQIRRRVPLGQTCSIGLVRHHPGDSLTKLMTRADHALYQAKSTGRDRVVAA